MANLFTIQPVSIGIHGPALPIVILFNYSNSFFLIYLSFSRLALNLCEYVLYPEISFLDSCGCSQSPIWVSVLVSVSNLFLVINSSANLIIYFSIGELFKKVVHRSNSVMPNLLRKRSLSEGSGHGKCKKHNAPGKPVF